MIGAVSVYGLVGLDGAFIIGCMGLVRNCKAYGVDTAEHAVWGLIGLRV